MKNLVFIMKGDYVFCVVGIEILRYTWDKCQPSRPFHGSGRCHSIMVKSRVRSRARFIVVGQN